MSVAGQGVETESASKGVRRRYALLRGDDDSGSDSDDAREVRVEVGARRVALRRLTCGPAPLQEPAARPPPRKRLDDSWASIGRDLAAVCRRLPEDIPYLVAEGGRWCRALRNPAEVALLAMLLLLVLMWFVQNVSVAEGLNLRQLLYGRHVLADDSADVILYEHPEPYAFLDRWPHQRDISEQTPEKCSYREQAKMRKQHNHLTMRLGMGLPDKKRRADLSGRIGIELVGKEHPHTEMEYLSHASLNFRGLPHTQQAQLDEYVLLSSVLNKCQHHFGTLHAVGDNHEAYVTSSERAWSVIFNEIHQHETEQEQVHEDTAHVQHLHKLGYKHVPMPGTQPSRLSIVLPAVGT